jgi:hypothetical protein
LTGPNEPLRGPFDESTRGLDNEVPFFIYPYAPEDALGVADARKRIEKPAIQLWDHCLGDQSL